MKMYRFIFAILSLIIGSSCATRTTELQTQLAGNRIMGFYIRSILSNGAPVDSNESRLFFNQAMSEFIRAAYASTPKALALIPGPLQSAENLYTIGEAEIDDLFVVDFKLPANFNPPSVPEVLGEYSPEETPDLTGSQIEFELSVINGAELKPVKLVRGLSPVAPVDKVFERLVHQLKASTIAEFNNPNIYPRSDPLYFGNLLFTLAQKRELEMSGQISCDNAGDIYLNFQRSFVLYTKATERGLDQVVGQQSKLHDMNQRREDSKAKAEILTVCENDRPKKFEINYEFGTIDANNQIFIRKALDRVKIESLLQQYTDKPVKFVFALQPTGEITLQVYLRFDPLRYRRWVTGRYPEVYQGYHILAMDPYYALMRTLVFLREALPPESPRPLVAPFSKMNINLSLETLLNGSAMLGVDGRVQPDKRVDLFYPRNLILKIPGFDAKNIGTRSDPIFQEKGWLALGSCKTIEGGTTEDGLTLSFFHLPCKL